MRDTLITVSQPDAVTVVEAIKLAFPEYAEVHHTIVVVRDHDYQGDCLVIWPEGPPAWSFVFPIGGRTLMGSHDVPAMPVPDSVWVDVHTDQSVRLQPADPFTG